MGAKQTILVIEDEEKQRRVVGLHLSSGGYVVKAAGTAEEGLKHASEADLVLTDLKLPGMDGLALLERLRSQNANVPVVVMSAFGTVEIAVASSRLAPGFGRASRWVSMLSWRDLDTRRMRLENGFIFRL